MARIKKSSDSYTAYAKGGTKMKKAKGGVSMTRLANMKKGGKKATATTMKKGGSMKKCRGGCY